VNLDETTLSVMTGVIVLVTGVPFVLRVTLSETSAAGSMWSNAFSAGVLAALSLTLWGMFESAWWASAVANAALVASVAALWSGARIYNRRRSLFLAGVVVAVVAGAAALVAGPEAGAWGGIEIYCGAVVVVTVLTVVEVLRPSSRMPRRLDTRLLVAVLLLMAVFNLGRLVVSLLLGVDDPIFIAAFSQQPEALMHAAFIITGATSLSVILASERADARRSGAMHVGDDVGVPGILPRRAFESEMQSWLDRADSAWDALILIELDVANLREIADAFGREQGERVIAAVGRLVVERVPTASLVGSLDDGRFAVLCGPPARQEPVSVAEQLQTALVDTPMEALDGLRAIADFGVATTDDIGYDAVELLRQVRQAVVSARSLGGGRIVVADGAPSTPASVPFPPAAGEASGRPAGPTAPRPEPAGTGRATAGV